MEHPTLEPERLGASLARAALLGAAFSAVVGALECALELARGTPRYGDVAWRMATAAVFGYAALGAALGSASGVFAWIFWRRPAFRAASASTCAGVGTFLAVASFVATHRVGPLFLLPAAGFWTLAALALRELLAWVPLAARPRPWLAFGALALGAGGIAYAVRGGDSAGAPPDALPPARMPHVVLVTIDTLRADHVGCYGARDAATPALDALAAEGVLFLDATSQANTTGPSHATMLTGLYPHVNGARWNGIPVAHGVRTLPEYLAGAGYQTAGFVSGFTLKQDACGLAPRFERYDDDFLAWRAVPEAATRLRLFHGALQVAKRLGIPAERVERPAGETIDAALDWLASRDPERPFFLWAHLFDPHCPYEPPAPFDALPEGAEPGAAGSWYHLTTRERRALTSDPRQVERMRALYRGEIAYADSQVKRLFDALRARGEWENTLVVFASDHGEGLGEHGYWFDHGTFLYDTELHVPLLVRFPGGADAGTRVSTQVRLLDIAPTVLDTLGLAVPDDLEGTSLRSALQGGAPRPSFAQGEVAGELSGYARDGRKLSLRAGGRKWVWTSDYWLDSERVPERWELFDLAQDPGESRDASAQVPPTADGEPLPPALEMRAHLELWRDATAPGADERPLTPEVRAQLERLGYF